MSLMDRYRPWGCSLNSALTSLLFLLLLLPGCGGEAEPIKVGFAGGLTGRHSDLGINGRNGVILAVEEVNQAGGINGRPVELITRDDKQDPDVARQIDQELIDLGVVAIIGHFTSAMSVAAVPVINRNRVVMISPTTSTNELTGLDDYFFRVMSPNNAAVNRLADHVFNSLGLQRVVVVYDRSNLAFTKGWFDHFQNFIASRSGKSVIPVPFTSGQDLRFTELSSEILSHNPDGVLIVAASLDTAMLSQHLRRNAPGLPFFSTMWAMTEDFLQHSGPAAENVVFAHWFYKEYQSDSSVRFRKHFQERFDRSANFASHFAYEAAQVLFTSLAINDDPALLKETISTMSRFEGIQGEIVIDQYGDPARKVFLMNVKDGQFQALE